MPRSTLAERETIIRWDDEERLVQVYSASPVWWRKLARLGFTVREETTRHGEVTGRFYEPVPVDGFRFRKKRTVSASHRARLQERGFLRRNRTKNRGSSQGTLREREKACP